MSTPPAPHARAARDTIVGVIVLAGVLGGAVAVSLAAGAGRPQWGRAVAFAALVAGAGGIGGWIVARRATVDPARRGGSALGATVLRVGPGLAALVWLAARGGSLREAGAGGLLVAFYLALLATAILLHIMLDPGSSTPRSHPPR